MEHFEETKNYQTELSISQLDSIILPFLRNHPVLKWNYKECKEYIAQAIMTNSPPSRELIAVNARLALWEVAMGIGKVSSFPSWLNFAITDVCNARCSFCAYVSERIQGKFLKYANFKNLDWIKFAHYLRFNVGLGEPLIHPNFSDMLRFMRDFAPYLDLSLITNGSVLAKKDDLIKLLTGYVSFLNISLNAATKKTYESTMNLKWDETLDGLKKLQASKVSKETKLPYVRVSYVLHKQNLTELVQLPHLLKTLGIDRVFVVSMIPPQERWGRRYKELMTEEDRIEKNVKLAQQYIGEFVKECKIHGIKIDRNLPKVYTENTDLDISDKKVFEERIEEIFDDDSISTHRDHDKGEINEAEIVAQNNVYRKPPETSIEFRKQVIDGHQPICRSPWLWLRVGMNDDMGICCNFFDKLPKFDWKNSREFADGAWNDPVLQYLRTTMHTKLEVPFCTFCRKKDKRNPKYSDEKKKIIHKSRDIFQNVYDKINFSRYHGSIKLVKDTKKTIVRNNLRFSKPFQMPPERYRRTLRLKGFDNLQNILQIGYHGVLSVFLAEMNENVTVADVSSKRLKYIERMTRKFNLKCKFHLMNDDLMFSNIKEKSLNAAWINGILMHRINRSKLLGEIYRLLEPDGIMYLHQYPSLGYVFNKCMGEKGKDEYYDNITEILNRGPLYGGKINFCDSKNVKRVMVDSGFEIDKEHGIIPKFVREEKADEGSYGEYAREYCMKLKNDQNLRLDYDFEGISEEFITVFVRKK